MKQPVQPIQVAGVLAITFCLLATPSHAQDWNLGATFFSAVQWGDFRHHLDDAGKQDDGETGSAGGLDLELSGNPGESNHIYLRARYVKGNGLNDAWPGALAPWANDLHDDHIDINDSGRNHLLEAWAGHRWGLGQGGASLQATAGIIDASAWLDDNAYADDEMSHFMNNAFITRAYMPAYDWGAALELNLGRLGINGVYMNSRTGDAADHRFHYLGAQMHYHAAPAFGAGTYRLWLYATSPDFLRSRTPRLTSRTGLGISIDQSLGDDVGLFLRAAWQSQRASVDYRAAYTIGLQLRGTLWHRAQDEAGLALGHLPGGNGEIARTRVAELYLRLGLHRHLDLTFDLQYIEDSLHTAGPGRSALIPGVRMVAAF